MPEDNNIRGADPRIERRQFLVLSAATIGGVLVYSLDRRVSRVFAQEKSTQTLKIPLRFFTEEEALIVAAAASRIIPTDDSGPGANEAGVVIFIDRQLAGPYGRDRYRYTQGPFEEDAAPEFGYQGKATPKETYREGLKGLEGFDKLSPEEQDKKLMQIERTHFFALLRQNTIEGMFSDPLHGGNVDMVGWQLVGFPGPRMSNYDDLDRHYGEAFRPKIASLEQIIGRKVRPSEDEDMK
ncbi:MAG: gluconate 2-dehydrogenase subunit 3 family protein [Candidatus Acidiferrales bacterium]|jgi:gluconate 2-dehydrogenase gamma chain